MGDDELKEIRSLLKDSVAMVNSCCLVLTKSIEYQAAAQKHQSDMLDRITTMLDMMVSYSDTRTEKIEDAVENLSAAARGLSKSHETTSKVVSHLEKMFTLRIDQAVESKNQLYESYQGLLKEFEAQRYDLQSLRKEYVESLKELARLPTTTITGKV